MGSNDQHFDEFIRRRKEASKAYTNGDAGPLSQIITRTLKATFFGPDGGVVQGADQVSAAYQKGAALFKSGDFAMETLDQGASDDIGYWVGLLRGTARMHDGKEASFNLRITEIYRPEGGEWKMVHRHADAPASKS